MYDLGVYPDLKTNILLRWARGGWSAGYNHRFISGFQECQNNACNDPSQPKRDVSAYNTGDLFGAYSFKSAAGRTTVAAGINNIVDADPAVIYNGFLAESDAATYDYQGRFLYFRLSQLF